MSKKPTQLKNSKSRSKYYYKKNGAKSALIKGLDLAKKNTIKPIQKTQNCEPKTPPNKNNITLPLVFPFPTNNIPTQPPQLQKEHSIIDSSQLAQGIHKPNEQQQNLFPLLPTISLVIKHKTQQEIVKKPEEPLLPKPIINKELVNINEKIENIDDLIMLCDKYPLDPSIEYNINMLKLHNIKQPLIQLSNMIGMKTLKKSIMYQILYYLQDLHKDSNGDFLHTCIYGPPGTGKTEVAKIMGSIFSKLGILNKGTFKKVNRSDLVAGYLGQTAIKTNKIIQENIGGVLFIDEAYSLGNKDKKDIFSKECLDTLCEALSAYKDNLMVIIAGYKDDLDSSFFSVNSGLNSRFNWRYNIEKYDEKELREIFFKHIEKEQWKINTKNIDNEFPISWFKEHMKYFKYFGRDMEILILKMKIAHSKRVFCLENNKKKVFNKQDLLDGFQLFIENEDVKDRKYGGVPFYAVGMYN